MFIGAAVGAGAVALGGLIAQTTTDGQSAGTSVAIIGAVAVVLVAAIGVINTFISNRRTSPSPPGSDLDLAGLHDRVTIVEQIIHDMRGDIANLSDRDDSIDARVIPLREVLDAKLADVYRRLDRLER